MATTDTTTSLLSDLPEAEAWTRLENAAASTGAVLKDWPDSDAEAAVRMPLTGAQAVDWLAERRAALVVLDPVLAAAFAEDIAAGRIPASTPRRGC